MRPIISFLVLLSAGLASAGSTGLPHLGDHTFVPMMDIDEPFVVTRVQTSISVGRAVNASVPVILPGEDEPLGTVKADLTVAGIGFGYRHAVTDWLAVDLGMLTIGRVGTSAPTLLAEGLTGAVGYDIGWLVRIHESRKSLLSGAVKMGSRSGTFVNLYDWATGIVEGSEVPLVRSRTSLGGSAGLSAAWGVSRRFGFLGQATLHYVESFEGTGDNDLNTDFRAGVSYDAGIDIHVPLGLALTAGRFMEDNAAGDKVPNWMWGLRIGLQGRDDFTIGLSFDTYYTELAYNGADLTLNQVAIDMRYYF